MAYSIGLDYGTNSVRCVIVDVKNGNEIGTNVYNYPTGKAGIIIDKKDHNVARQNPAGYLEGIVVTLKKSISQAKRNRKGFKPEQIIGIGVDATGSTPLPVNQDGVPLALTKEFRKNPNAHAWLWKDHTSYAVVLGQITAIALGIVTLNENQKDISRVFLDKYYFRKHGKNVYYGQKS